MAKRRAEDTLLHDSPSKRCCRALCSVDMQLESTPPTGGVSLSPPSLLALLGSRCRKRPYYFEDPQREQEEEAAAAIYRKATHVDSRRRHAANVLTVQTSGSFQDRGSSSSPTSLKKRPREDCAFPDTTKAKDKAADGDTSTEDCTFNSFQYWRVPLPELDLSLLEDVNRHSQIKPKSKMKDCSSDAMET
ncbi:uncharacterized protein wu:fa19b12 [Seriola aureovittata]|uniref:uncharacterized protein wu:fa19b12 n=1 Tax=Seriola aureovittata TaxID=2871759 RepID=UPI0024BE91D6|nr:uncharacterized protein wu:fa19b12 [Seriola aureovittata]